MKKILVISFLIILLTSCTNVLDKKPLDSLSDVDVWNNTSMVQLFIMRLRLIPIRFGKRYLIMLNLHLQGLFIIFNKQISTNLTMPDGIIPI
jgi:hypothetical protein